MGLVFWDSSWACFGIGDSLVVGIAHRRNPYIAFEILMFGRLIQPRHGLRKSFE